MDSDEAIPEPAIEAPDMKVFWAAHAAHRQSDDLNAATGILADDCVLFEPFHPPTLSLDGKEEQHVLEGNYSAVLEQDADGDWKVKRFMALPSKPFPPELMERAPGPTTKEHPRSSP